MEVIITTKNSKSANENEYPQIITYIGIIIMAISLFIPGRYYWYFGDFNHPEFGKVFFDITVWYWIFGLVIVHVEHSPQVSYFGQGQEDYYLYFMIPDVLGVILTIIIIYGMVESWKIIGKVIENEVEDNKAGRQILIWSLISVLCYTIWVYVDPIVLWIMRPFLLRIYGPEVDYIYGSKGPPLRPFIGFYIFLAGACISIAGAFLLNMEKKR